jgi:hypothetical protein
MPSRVQIVQRIEDNGEGLEPCNIEYVVFDIGVIGFDVYIGVKSARRLLRNLVQPLATTQSHPFCTFTTYQRLGLLDVFVAEEELPVQVAQIDRVEVDDVDLAKTCENKILEKLTADATSSHHEHARLPCY